MNANEFLIKIAKLFPADEPQSVFKERLEKYAEILAQKEAEKKNELDYEKMLNLIVEKYPYRIFPNLSEILKHICYKQKKRTEIAEPKVHVIKIMGVEYEFTEVDSSWEGVHTLSDFKDCPSYIKS